MYDRYWLSKVLLQSIKKTAIQRFIVNYVVDKNKKSSS